MKHVSNMTDLFERLNELKVVFRYSEKLIPIIQNLMDFMKETVPLLENINSSLIESTSKIPKASDQLNNISSATELATTEILDIVDSISIDMERIEKSVKDVKSKEEEKLEIWQKIKTILGSEPSSAELVQKYEALNNFLPIVPGMLDAFQKVKNDVYNITLSLQVQDITTQQLAAVNHLIESVRSSLSSLMMHLDDSEIKSFDGFYKDMPVVGTFDPNAEYTKSTERQDAADVLINDRNSKTTQDEIDKLFS
ncbi:MAG: protein phosphatase CheZ [Ignavibacteriaceae bacterium]|nr:protein phosphatase CheZ [Ignavibacteriaceae bacterium]